MVNDNEYYLDELLNCVYEWDKGLVIRRFKDNYNDLANLDLIVEFLDDNLPETLEYL